MLLAIDIGNTSIKVGFFNKGRLASISRIITKIPAKKRYYLTSLKKILKGKKIDAAIVVSVVPEATGVIKNILRKDFNIKAFVVGKNIKVPIKNLYKNPRQVGQDRLVDAYAGLKKYGPGLIIIDFGTAVTFDVISQKGAYLGGIIVPGIETSLSALSNKAALLPKTVFKEPKTLIGKDTVTSMRSGILFGYASLCEGLVKRIRQEMGNDYKVIITGGHSELISKLCRFRHIQPNLTLQGLYLLYKNC